MLHIGEPSSRGVERLVRRAENAVTRKVRSVILERQNALKKNDVAAEKKDATSDRKSLSDEPSFSFGLKQTQETENETSSKKETCHEAADAPSFSIGLTQLFAEKNESGQEPGVGRGENLIKKFFNLPTYAREEGGVQQPLADQRAQLAADQNTPGKVVEAANTHKKAKSWFNDVPSFSVGLTQSQQDKDIDGIASEEDRDEHETIAERMRRKFQEKLVARGKIYLDPTDVMKWKPALVQENPSIVNRYTEEEKAVWNMIWGDDTRGVVLFDNNKLRISDVKVWRTMQTGTEVDGRIIDCMCFVLNEEGKNTQRGGPRRLFCARDVVLNWLLPSTTNNEESILKGFSKGILESVGQNTYNNGLADYELVFIPVLENGHYYVIVFELSNPSIYLLDNVSTETSLVDLTDADEYFDKPTAYKVKHLFVGYLRLHMLDFLYARTRQNRHCQRRVES